MFRRWVKTKRVALLLIIPCVLLITILSTGLRSRKELECFFQTNESSLPELKETEPKSGSAIFFHETSCPENLLDINLSFRQACSIESALLAHPNKDVFLLVSSPVKVPIEDVKNILVKQLLMDYPNLKIRYINFERYLENTPVYPLYYSGGLFSSRFPTSHASDVLRFTTLYKFGGIYLDLDVIVLRSMDNLTNFAGSESERYIGSGIIGFGKDLTGREVAIECAFELSSTFDGDSWGYNGPGVITRVLTRRCQNHTLPQTKEKNCKGFHIHPPPSFTPVSYVDSELIFKIGKTNEFEKMINNSYTIHVWNKLTSDLELKEELDIPYIKLAQAYCPKVYECGKKNLVLK